ncbi:hypothetical protein V8C86DRAFT_2696520 [Haematococcus lacustris]
MPPNAALAAFALIALLQTAACLAALMPGELSPVLRVPVLGNLEYTPQPGRAVLVFAYDLADPTSRYMLSDAWSLQTFLRLSPFETDFLFAPATSVNTSEAQSSAEQLSWRMSQAMLAAGLPPEVRQARLQQLFFATQPLADSSPWVAPLLSLWAQEQQQVQVSGPSSLPGELPHTLTAPRLDAWYGWLPLPPSSPSQPLPLAYLANPCLPTLDDSLVGKWVLSPHAPALCQPEAMVGSVQRAGGLGLVLYAARDQEVELLMPADADLDMGLSPWEQQQQDTQQLVDKGAAAGAWPGPLLLGQAVHGANLQGGSGSSTAHNERYPHHDDYDYDYADYHHHRHHPHQQYQTQQPAAATLTAAPAPTKTGHSARPATSTGTATTTSSTGAAKSGYDARGTLEAVAGEAAQEHGVDSLGWGDQEQVEAGEGMHIPLTMVSYEDGVAMRNMVDSASGLQATVKLTTQLGPASFFGISAQGKLLELGWLQHPTLMHMTWQAQHQEYLAALEQLKAAEPPAVELEVFKQAAVSADRPATAALTLPGERELRGYTRLELDLGLSCKAAWDKDCPAGGQVVQLLACCGGGCHQHCFNQPSALQPRLDGPTSLGMTLGLNPATPTLCGFELGRWVTPSQRRAGAWLTDVTPLLPLLQPGQCQLSLHTSPAQGAGTGSWEVSLSLRFSHWLPLLPAAPGSNLFARLGLGEGEGVVLQAWHGEVEEEEADQDSAFTVQQVLGPQLLGEEQQEYQGQVDVEQQQEGAQEQEGLQQRLEEGQEGQHLWEEATQESGKGGQQASRRMRAGQSEGSGRLAPHQLLSWLQLKLTGPLRGLLAARSGRGSQHSLLVGEAALNEEEGAQQQEQEQQQASLGPQPAEATVEAAHAVKEAEAEAEWEVGAQTQQERGPGVAAGALAPTQAALVAGDWQRLVPLATAPLFQGGDVDVGYNARPTLRVAVPPGAVKAVIMAVISSHGANSSDCAPGSCPTSHHFTVNGQQEHVASFEQEDQAWGCAQAVRWGAVPNGRGSWYHGCHGPCGGQQVLPWLADVSGLLLHDEAGEGTAIATTRAAPKKQQGQEVKEQEGGVQHLEISYKALLNGKPLPAPLPGLKPHVLMMSAVTFWGPYDPRFLIPHV